jgi:hypothetical protein
MPLASFYCAIGDSPAVTLAAAATVNLAPPDDSVDTNRVIITGSGTISSFGVACQGVLNEAGQPATVTKRVTFVPNAGQTITLHHNPPALSLYSLADRPMTGRCFATYQSDANGNWQETSFLIAPIIPGAAPPPSGEFWGYFAAGGSTTVGIPARVTRARAQMWGGTGGSVSYSGIATGGTGASGYVEKFLTGLTPNATLAFTCGAGGAPGAAGTASILASGSQAIGTLIAGGSSGGNASALGSAGGTASGGDINLTGQSGSDGNSSTSDNGGAGCTMYSLGAPGGGSAGNNGGLIITWSN